MGKCPFMSVILLVLFACTTDPNLSGGPRLVQEVTVEPTIALPTRVPSATPVIIAVATSEITSPVPVATVEGRYPGYVLVTPTLPPSKTPTPTQTITPTFTQTRPPTATVLPPLFPTLPPFTSANNPGVNTNRSQPCATNWFFSQSIANACPLAEAMTSSASYQQFQHGFMIWVGQQDAIYVAYDSEGQPRWQVFKDNFVDGTPEYDPSMVVIQPNYTWQPRRGFGSIWRDNPALRERIGWAVREWEEPYDVRLQIGLDGSVFLADPSGGIIALRPGGEDWERYT